MGASPSIAQWTGVRFRLSTTKTISGALFTSNYTSVPTISKARKKEKRKKKKKKPPTSTARSAPISHAHERAVLPSSSCTP